MRLDDAPRVQNGLAQHHIYIRSMNHLPGLTGYLRVTLGSSEQMHRFLTTLEAVLKA